MLCAVNASNARIMKVTRADDKDRTLCGKRRKRSDGLNRMVPAVSESLRTLTWTSRWFPQQRLWRNRQGKDKGEEEETGTKSSDEGLSCFHQCCCGSWRSRLSWAEEWKENTSHKHQVRISISNQRFSRFPSG